MQIISFESYLVHYKGVGLTKPSHKIPLKLDFFADTKASFRIMEEQCYVEFNQQIFLQFVSKILVNVPRYFHKYQTSK